MIKYLGMANKGNVGLIESTLESRSSHIAASEVVILIFSEHFIHLLVFDLWVILHELFLMSFYIVKDAIMCLCMSVFRAEYVATLAWDSY